MCVVLYVHVCLFAVAVSNQRIFPINSLVCWGIFILLVHPYILGLIWDVSLGRLGLELSVRGFSQRAPALLTDLTAALASFDPCGERELAAFDNVKKSQEE